jgi:hypothetical protein
MRQFLILLLVLNVISAALFIGFVNSPVYDDPPNILDVHNYATKGLSLDTLLSQRNPPGPTSFLWMAAGVRLLGGEELRDARIAVLVSWVLLAAGILVGARYSRFPELWYGALTVTLVFPHAVEAMATLLTEGPSLLFAVLGVLAWTEFASRPNVTLGFLSLGTLGGLSMGLAVTCRQYNLALLPAAACFALYQSRKRGSGKDLRWLVGMILSLALSVIPVLFMIFFWKGISSPSMATGMSYQNWKAGLGLNFFRPVVASFYTAVYMVPLSFPAMQRLKLAMRWGALLVALLGGLMAAMFGSSLLQPGPLRTLVHCFSRVPAGEFMVLGLVAGVTIINTIAFCNLLWDERVIIFSNPLIIFALLVVMFFIAEQFGVGGNLPFYDRYVLQIAPFLGIIGFSLLPRLTYPRVAALMALSIVSQVMLWRYAFGTVVS